MKNIKRKRTVLTSSEKIKMVERYIDGESAEVLAKIYNVDPTTVRLNVRRAGAEVRTLSAAARQYTYNHDFFKNINTEAKAYFLGLLMADGCIYRNDVILGVQTRDRHILESFVKAVNGNNSIKDKVVKGGYLSKSGSFVSTLGFYSTNMANDLKQLGVVERKTFNVKIPKLKTKLERHFWRGVFDGDGTIVCNPDKRQLSVAICGHIKTINAFADFLRKHDIVPNKIRPVASIFNTCITTNKALKFLNLIYTDSNPELCLKRKYVKYLEYKHFKQEF